MRDPLMRFAGVSRIIFSSLNSGSVRPQNGLSINHDDKRSRMIGELAEDAVKFADVTDHLLDCGDNLALLTLKGHLVVEHLLGIILMRLLNIPALPAPHGRLGFYQKLKLVEAVVCVREPGPNADSSSRSFSGSLTYCE